MANKKIDLSDEEYTYYKDIESSVGREEFVGLFTTDKNGLIKIITPSSSKTTSMLAIFFLLNVMMNQRLRKLDDKIIELDDLNDRVAVLERAILKDR